MSSRLSPSRVPLPASRSPSSSPSPPSSQASSPRGSPRAAMPIGDREVWETKGLPILLEEQARPCEKCGKECALSTDKNTRMYVLPCWHRVCVMCLAQSTIAHNMRTICPLAEDEENDDPDCREGSVFPLLESVSVRSVNQQNMTMYKRLKRNMNKDINQSRMVLVMSSEVRAYMTILLAKTTTNYRFLSERSDCLLRRLTNKLGTQDIPIRHRCCYWFIERFLVDSTSMIKIKDLYDEWNRKIESNLVAYVRSLRAVSDMPPESIRYMVPDPPAFEAVAEELEWWRPRNPDIQRRRAFWHEVRDSILAFLIIRHNDRFKGDDLNVFDDTQLEFLIECHYVPTEDVSEEDESGAEADASEVREHVSSSTASPPESVSPVSPAAPTIAASPAASVHSKAPILPVAPILSPVPVADSSAVVRSPTPKAESPAAESAGPNPTAPSPAAPSRNAVPVASQGAGKADPSGDSDHEAESDTSPPASVKSGSDSGSSESGRDSRPVKSPHSSSITRHQRKERFRKSPEKPTVKKSGRRFTPTQQSASRCKDEPEDSEMEDSDSQPSGSLPPDSANTDRDEGQS